MSGLATAGGGRGVYALFAALGLLLSLSANAVAQMRDGETAVIEQPFDSAPVTLPGGAVVAKWQGLQTRLETDWRTILLCGADPIACNSPEALQFIAMVEQAQQYQGLGRLGTINRSVNMSIRFMSDIAQYGQDDLWSSPLETLATGNGDCEDYAILKLAILRAAGIDESDLRLVLLRSANREQDHAVAAVRLEGTWRILDNRYLPMLRDWQLTDYRPLFVLDSEGVHAYVDPNVAISGDGFLTDMTARQAALPSERRRDASIITIDDVTKHL